jgi:hypothetical protein
MTTIDQRPAQTPPEVVRVPSADDMDLHTFCCHMTLRHADSLGGMPELSPYVQSDYTEELWRTFHDKLHDKKLYPFQKFDHYHRKPSNG